MTKIQTTIKTISNAPAQPLGLAAYMEQDPRCVACAFRGGLNYFFFYSLSATPFIEALQPLVRKSREDLLIATGNGSRKPKALLATLKKLQRALHTPLIDVFFAEYISDADRPAAIFGSGGVLDCLQQWKAQQMIRYVGATTHNRQIARRLAEDPRVDVLMHRFNMAHRKAAEEVFPAARQSQTPVVAFTATRWGTLLEPLDGWTGDVPTAADCYRYCLTQPAVQIVLSGPTTVQQLNANLEVLQRPRMNKRERQRWERFGDAVYGQGKDSYETMWP